MGEPKQKLAQQEERLLACAGVQTVEASTDWPSDAHEDIRHDTRSVKVRAVIGQVINGSRLQATT